MARYVVTGGGGFIGSNLVESLLGSGEQVVAFDDFSTGIAPGGLIETILGLPLGLNNLWLQFFTWNTIPPADGSDICNDLPP